MGIDENKIYFLKNDHFEKYKNYKLFTDFDNKDKGARPHYLCIKKNEVCWVIPLSSRVEKYEELYNKEIAKYGKSTKFHFLTLNGRESVLLIQNAFPISYSSIESEYTQMNKPLNLTSQKEIKTIRVKLERFKDLISKGFTFFPNQSNVIKLEKEIINDVKTDRYINSLHKENSVLVKPFVLDKPIINLIIEYNKSFDIPKSLNDICSDFKIDKNKATKNPLLQSIGTYFSTQQENEKTNSIKPKEIITETKIANKIFEPEM